MSDNILATLTYFSNFNFPLTKDELWQYLCVERTFGATNPDYRIVGDDASVVPFDEFDSMLSELLSAEKVKIDGAYYSLFDGTNLVSRQEREKTSLQKINQASRIFKNISWWPFLQGVFVTGSVAAMNASESSDIDVLIITSKDALWLTRFVVVIYLKLVGVYRKVICPNIWLTEETLEWGRHDLPSAVDAVLTKPVVRKNRISERFLAANLWIKNYLPNVEISDTPQIRARCTLPLRIVNRLFFEVQLIFMKPKVTSEEVTLKKVHFKKVDNHQRSHPHVTHPTA